MPHDEARNDPESSATIRRHGLAACGPVLGPADGGAGDRRAAWAQPVRNAARPGDHRACDLARLAQRHHRAGGPGRCARLAGAAIAFGPALYGQGRFYASVERFHLFATCNVWVARRLRDGGLELHPPLALTAGMLVGQLARHVPPAAASSASAAAATPAAN
jgi:hypothetical protein